MSEDSAMREMLIALKVLEIVALFGVVVAPLMAGALAPPKRRVRNGSIALASALGFVLLIVVGEAMFGAHYAAIQVSRAIERSKASHQSAP